MPKITFPNQEIKVPVGKELQKLPEIYPEIPLKFGCRRGECGTCLIEVTAGEENLTKKTPEEIATLSLMKKGPTHRLACQCALNGDISISHQGTSDRSPKTS